MEQTSKSIIIERASDTFEFSHVFPIPTESEVFIGFNLLTEQEIQWSLFDFSGQEVQADQVLGKKGINQLQIDLTTFSAGIYFIQIDNGQSQLVQRIVKQ